MNDLESSIEILDSKNYLEEIFNQNVYVFSYPYGKVNQSSYDMIKKYYKFAVCTKRSRYIISKHNSYLLPRIPINPNTSFFKFILKFFTIYEDIKYKNDLSMQL